MKQYLTSSEFIDWQHPHVIKKAKELTGTFQSHEAIARSCFEFVCDEIKHSIDYKMNPVTCKASEVLKYGTGFCYAKSHLLAALLRANGIPSALCYQRLTIDNDQPPFCLHGLNAVHLPNIGWYRIDARGNKDGVRAAFTPPHERLAFDIRIEGELNYAKLYTEPLPEIISVLTNSATYDEVLINLPDSEMP